VGRPEVAVADRYIYQVAVESFFTRATRGRLDPATRAKLRELGVALDEPLLSVYPADVFHRAVAVASQSMYPEGSSAEAHFRAGRDHIDAFVESYPGKMMAALARQIDTRMILEYTATFIRLGNNFTESRSRPLTPTRAELWLNDVGNVPGWYRGIVQRGLEVANVKGVSVVVTPASPPPSVTFDVTWAAR
jgi:uncharacterized protein (TIGR02265 family)